MKLGHLSLGLNALLFHEKYIDDLIIYSVSKFIDKGKPIIIMINEAGAT